MIRFVAFLILLFPAVALAQQQAPAIEILSKDDARLLFTMTEEQWQANVRQSVAAGIAQAMGSPETGVGMVMVTAEGDLLVVRPLYVRDAATPDLIQVTVVYRDPRAAFFTDTVLEEAVAAAKQQMKPEYYVTGSVERTDDGVSVFFNIVENVSD